VEARLLGRNVIGVDVNPEAVRLCREAVDFEWESGGAADVRRGDARNLHFIADNGVDFICTHPPFADLVAYGGGDDDLSRLSAPEFLTQMRYVARECHRVLKPEHYCAVLMGDTRENGYIVPLGSDIRGIFETEGFRTKEIIIKQQNNGARDGYWKTNSVKYNFLLIAHEYLFVFKKDAQIKMEI
jgi:DNA modification methylase